MVVVDRGQESLSSREVSLLFALEAHKSIRQIAQDLGLVEGTVKNRLSALYKKVGARNRSDAIEYGRSHGYFSTQS